MKIKATSSIGTITTNSSERSIELELWVKTAMCLKNKVSCRPEDITIDIEDAQQWVELRFCKTLLHSAIRQLS